MRRLVQVVALLVLVALGAQIGFCAFDDCGSGDLCGGTSQSSNHCHNCICVGAAAQNIPTLVPSMHMSLLVSAPDHAVREAEPHQLYLPPRA